VGIVILYYIGRLAAVRRTRYHIDTHDRRYPYARGYAQRGVLSSGGTSSLTWTTAVTIPLGGVYIQGTGGIGATIA
jgi:hypothetical protein